jgi:hypothetical protein
MYPDSQATKFFQSAGGHGSPAPGDGARRGDHRRNLLAWATTVLLAIGQARPGSKVRKVEGLPGHKMSAINYYVHARLSVVPRSNRGNH